MPKRKRQFRGTSKPKKHYDLKIWHIGYSRVLAVSRLIPKDWIYVRVIPHRDAEDHVLLHIECLAEEKETAYKPPPSEAT